MGDAAISFVWPKVSIMIPTYGQADVIMKAIDGALRQDYPNLEVIVVDDASPDDTAGIVSQCNDPRLRYHRNADNLGRVANYRNTLYCLATGDWVVNLDGDDYYSDPGFIGAAMRAAMADDTTVMVAARRAVEQDGRIVDVTEVPKASSWAGIDLVRKLPASSCHFSHMATLYRRSLAMELDFYRRDLVSTDWESLYRLALRGRVAFVDRIVGVWCASDQNASRVADWRERAKNLQIWPEIFAAAVQAGMSQAEVRKVQASTMRYFAYIGFSDVLMAAGPGAAWAYLVALGQNHPKTALRLFFDPRCVLRLCLAAVAPGKRAK